MFLLPGAARATASPADLRAAAECEWALLREFDAVLGRAPGQRPPADPMRARLAALGLAHEQAVLRALHREHRGRIVTISRPRHTTEAYAAAAAATAAALRDPDSQVVYQGCFAGERFLGFADFVVRDDHGRWQVWDTKLAREATVAALLQLAAYADLLVDLGVPSATTAALVLGDGDRQEFPLDEITPVVRSRLRRLLDLLDAHQDEGDPAQWGDPRVHACGRCPACAEQLAATRDVALVAGVYTTQRKRLRAAGVTTLDGLADRVEPVADLPAAQLDKLRSQARLQRDQRDHGRVSAEVFHPTAILALPPPDAGDLFFDFEGDPLWSEPGSPRRGLEYLFGVLETPCVGVPARYRAFWAHDRAGEKQALIDFVDYVERRRQLHLGMHIYHYADYERSRLLSLAARYGVCEAAIDDLLRAGVLVDLYAVVRASVRVSQDSYSIKKLEPLYMGDDLRGGVATAGESIVVYHEFTQAQIEGRQDEAARLLESIRSYNEYDCLSTLRLRDWLLTQVAGRTPGGAGAVAGDAATSGAPVTGVVTGVDLGRAGSTLVPSGTESQSPAKTSPWALAEDLQDRLRALVADIPPLHRTADEQAVALVAAAMQYNRREAKPYWWRHFDRLRTPVDEWADHSDVVHLESVQVTREWFKEGRQRSQRRLLDVVGTLGQGSRPLKAGDRLQVVYDAPAPIEMEPTSPAVRVAATTVTITSVTDEPGDRVRLTAEESLPQRLTSFDATPIAFTPAPGPGTIQIDTALTEIGAAVAGTWPQLPAGAGIDLLRRVPPRLRSRDALPRLDGSPEQYVTAVRDAVLDLGDSYLAVQGPPGTGKTHVAAHVIAELVARHGWRVGVVAQSHAAVENVLDAVVRAGLDPSLVGKQSQHREQPMWTDLPERQLALFASDHAATGYLLGGTVYDFVHPGRVARGQLDLLVVDEAGQFSLANTLAASVAARRLLLLGDPQQLPEVSQGTHPEPIHTSALGWLIEDQPTLPPERGYFLATTHRLHPRLAEAISQLSYAGSLTARSSAEARRALDGVEPGLHVLPVTHRDNTTSSPEEAEAIADEIAALLGRTWHDPAAGEPRPLEQTDVLVVTPYNAQVHRLREVLQDRGLGQVPVGTVDKFQGQEGAVVFVSMAASARADVARGVGFLLDRNRLNVALSRGKWAATIVCSPQLADFSPATPRELSLLGAFLQLTEPARTTPPASRGSRMEQPTLF